MNEQTVSDERLKEIVRHMLARPSDEQPTCHPADEEFGRWHRAHYEWQMALIPMVRQVAQMARELLTRREADRLAEVAKRVPSDDDLKPPTMPDPTPEAASVKRYDTQLYSSTLYERKDGRYVTYTDFAAAIAERDAARAECERLREVCDLPCESEQQHPVELAVIRRKAAADPDGTIDQLTRDLQAAREQDRELRRAAQALIEKVEAAQSFGREIAVLKSALAGETMNELERVVRDCEHCTFYGPEKLWRLKPICWNDTVRSMASSHVTPRKDFYCNQFQPRSLTDERTDRE